MIGVIVFILGMEILSLEGRGSLFRVEIEFRLLIKWVYFCIIVFFVLGSFDGGGVMWGVVIGEIGFYIIFVYLVFGRIVGYG